MTYRLHQTLEGLRMKDDTTLAILIIVIGVVLFTTGLFHRSSTLARWDEGVFQTIYGNLHRYRGFFRYMWPLGTTPVAVVLIAMTFIISIQIGLVTTVVFALATVLERTVKMKFRRPRPFGALSDVTMYQPRQPRDPSHPSGDALRVWFLALVIPAAFGLSWPVYFLTCSIATILSLGRIVLGVHYPLDVLGGAGLGFLAAGLSVIVFQLAVIS
jgi:undecaprenyl-diphosphatase